MRIKNNTKTTTANRNTAQEFSDWDGCKIWHTFHTHTDRYGKESF